MCDETLHQCGRGKLRRTKKVCATSKENAEKIMKKFLKDEAERYCQASYCPDDDKDCRSEMAVIGEDANCKLIEGHCSEGQRLYECTGEVTAECGCRPS